jgi:hypothetical protein
MSTVQIFTCPECGEKIEFDPGFNSSVTTSINRSLQMDRKRGLLNQGKGLTRTEMMVKAYLTCSQGHVHAYNVIKTY